MNADSLTIIKNLECFFSDRTRTLINYQETTRAYIVNVFKTAKKETSDYSKESVTIIYAKAKFEHRFDLFQNLGDWILFAQTFYPESLQNASVEYYNAIAQDSYHRCYRLLNRQWGLFEELADNFPNLVTSLRTVFIEPDEKSQDSSPSPLIRI